MGAQGLRVLIILLLAWLLRAAAKHVIRVFRTHMARRTAADELTRIETLARVFQYAASFVILIVAGALILDTFGLSVAPILATAGVAGLAIGFGAQSLIKDYFTGFFILVEDQIREGDVVEVSGKAGVVEEVTLRYVRLRDGDGFVHFVPNGEIKLVTNRTRGFARAVIDIGVGYGVDLEQAFGVMREVAQSMRADDNWKNRIGGDLEVLGVDKLDNSAVVLRVQLRVVPPVERDNVKREYLKRIKLAFDAQGIEIPFPQLTLHGVSLPTPK